MFDQRFDEFEGGNDKFSKFRQISIISELIIFHFRQVIDKLRKDNPAAPWYLNNISKVNSKNVYH